MWAAMLKGFAPARPAKLVPRGKPYHFWVAASCGAMPMSVFGKGTVPSAVMPYQILLKACACTLLTQLAAGAVPPSATHSTAAIERRVIAALRVVGDVAQVLAAHHVAGIDGGISHQCRLLGRERHAAKSRW